MQKATYLKFLFMPWGWVFHRCFSPKIIMLRWPPSIARLTTLHETDSQNVNYANRHTRIYWMNAWYNYISAYAINSHQNEFLLNYDKPIMFIFETMVPNTWACNPLACMILLQVYIIYLFSSWCSIEMSTHFCILQCNTSCIKCCNSLTIVCLFYYITISSFTFSVCHNY